MKKHVAIFGIFLISILNFNVFAHCEIPCGIYNDQLRLDLIKEHARTIEKSVTHIVKLSTTQPSNQNQIVRWISNKEKHASKIQKIMAQYFLHQRIKIVKKEENQEKYVRLLKTAHKVMVLAMKNKQIADLETVKKLKRAIKVFSTEYLDNIDSHKH